MAAEGFDLTGKKALVIGAASDSSKAIAQALSEAGAVVETQSPDPALSRAVEAAVAEAKSKLGGIDVLVNCLDLFIAKPVDQITDDGRVRK
jgi:NAD(P)-dependent dehydrogenase (short-subunit alcohol dehydrogenase family)